MAKIDKSFIKRNLALIIVAVLALMAVVSTATTVNTHKRNITAQQEKITHLRSELAIKEADSAKKTEEATQKATGVEGQRKQKDDAAADELFKVLFSWSDYASYMKNRATLVETYKLSESDPVLKTFMPKVEDRADSAGKHYNQIDSNKMNSAFVKSTTRVVSIGGTDYRYFAVVEASTTGTASSTEKVSSFYMLNYTVNADGKISKLTVTRMAEAPTRLS